ncbi:unnamed protein product [Rangifer tarandus platyrhynchus]|uniref:Uncharacterized protein n=1 Tax=Rangifer tarandus platyrhynchus TaxID=3082113 RepID=A0ABN8Z2K1_RANTA|nr:unnamed protein product [Rangifer tarandus platyrhynchus]
MAEAEEEGAAPRAQSPEPLRPRHAHVHKIPSAPGPNAPSQDPEGGLGGRTAAEPFTRAPCPLPRPASSPLLGPGSKKVLGWADSGVNSIEFSFGYTLKAKVSWTYSQNG